MLRRLVASLTLALVGVSAGANPLVERALQANAKAYAPDARTVEHRVAAKVDGKSVTLTGVSMHAEATNALVAELKRQGFRVTNGVVPLPDVQTLGDLTWGVVNVPIANLHEKAGYASTLATQAVMGTPVKVLRREGSWLRVQLPDGYLGWVRAAQLQRMTTDELARHNQRKRVVVTSFYCPVVSAGTKTAVAHLPAGSIVALRKNVNGYYVVQLPDGRTGRVSAEHAESFDAFVKRTERAKASADPMLPLINTARSLLGQPYEWGGTSVGGMDCSGFVQTVFRLNNYLLPRDASQMGRIVKGDERQVAPLLSEPGDLLFFGRRPTESRAERIVHVGLATGKGRMIHSLDVVKEGSLDPADALFDRTESERFLFGLSKDLFATPNPCWNGLQHNGFYQSPPVDLTPCVLK